MKAINISVTAKRNETRNIFEGVIIFTNELEITRSYIFHYKETEQGFIDLAFYYKNEDFFVRGLLDDELLQKLTKKQKTVFLLTIECIDRVIAQTEFFPEKITKFVEIFGVIIEIVVGTTHDVEDETYWLIFK